jgi:hypothetical protein
MNSLLFVATRHASVAIADRDTAPPHLIRADLERLDGGHGGRTDGPSAAPFAKE